MTRLQGFKAGVFGGGIPEDFVTDSDYRDGYRDGCAAVATYASNAAGVSAEMLTRRLDTAGADPEIGPPDRDSSGGVELKRQDIETVQRDLYDGRKS